ncbi:MAG: restriction endonuclease [Burkholderiales bacterium]|nr:restriction endonuclease [Burkholderiales bacterium]
MAAPTKKKQATPGPKTVLSFTDAAEKILHEVGKPQTHKHLAQKAITEKLVQTESETPEISMHVSIRSEMKRRELRGEPQRFVFLGNGVFSLVELVAGKPTEKTKTALDQVRESRREAAEVLYKKLTSVNNGPNFETMVADLLVAMGYQEVQVVGGKDDQGVDILCEKRDGLLKIRIAVQCKCKALNQKVSPKDISTLRDNLSTYQCQQGIVVTTSQLNDVAKTKAKEAGKEPIYYIEHDELLDLFAEHNVGIRSEPIRFYQVDASQYDFLK